MLPRGHRTSAQAPLLSMAPCEGDPEANACQRDCCVDLLIVIMDQVNVGESRKSGEKARRSELCPDETERCSSRLDGVALIKFILHRLVAERAERSLQRSWSHLHPASLIPVRGVKDRGKNMS